MTDERTAIDMRGTLSELTFPKVGEGSLVVSTGDKQSRAQPKDLFAVNKRKSWDKTVEARCDFTYKLSLTRRSDVDFIDAGLPSCRWLVGSVHLAETPSQGEELCDAD